MRAGAFVQAALLVLMTAVVMTRAHLAFSRWHPLARRLIWVVVAFFAVGTVLNTITPSAMERLIWLPVVIALLACSLVVARGR